MLAFDTNISIWRMHSDTGVVLVTPFHLTSISFSLWKDLTDPETGSNMSMQSVAINYCSWHYIFYSSVQTHKLQLLHSLAKHFKSSPFLQCNNSMLSPEQNCTTQRFANKSWTIHVVSVTNIWTASTCSWVHNELTYYSHYEYHGVRIVWSLATFTLCLL